MTGPERRGALIALGGLLAIAAVRRMPATRARDQGTLASGGVWIETAGDVDRPGLRRHSRPISIVRAAKESGARCVPRSRGSLTGGKRVVVRERGCSVRVSELSARVRLVLGIPLDPNTDGAADLERLPGIGRRLAEAIVRERPYGSVDELERVRGIGPKTIARLRPWLAIATGPTAAIPEARP